MLPADVSRYWHGIMVGRMRKKTARNGNRTETLWLWAAELQGRGLPTWDQDDFAADKVATQLYPHSPPTESESD